MRSRPNGKPRPPDALLLGARAAWVAGREARIKASERYLRRKPKRQGVFETVADSGTSTDVFPSLAEQWRKLGAALGLRPWRVQVSGVTDGFSPFADEPPPGRVDAVVDQPLGPGVYRVNLGDEMLVPSELRVERVWREPGQPYVSVMLVRSRDGLIGGMYTLRVPEDGTRSPTLTLVTQPKDRTLVSLVSASAAFPIAQADTSRRLVRVLLGSRLLAALVTNGAEIVARCVGGLPRDCRVVDARWVDMSVELVLEHETFAPLADGAVIPLWEQPLMYRDLRGDLRAEGRMAALRDVFGRDGGLPSVEAQDEPLDTERQIRLS